MRVWAVLSVMASNRRLAQAVVDLLPVDLAEVTGRHTRYLVIVIIIIIIAMAVVCVRACVCVVHMITSTCPFE
jgi:carbon starvation protein CstA